MHALAGPTAKVTSCTLANLGHPGIAVEDACIATLRFENGAFGLFTVALYTQPPIREYEVIGNLGCVIMKKRTKASQDVFLFHPLAQRPELAQDKRKAIQPLDMATRSVRSRRWGRKPSEAGPATDLTGMTEVSIINMDGCTYLPACFATQTFVSSQGSLL